MPFTTETPHQPTLPGSVGSTMGLFLQPDTHAKITGMPKKTNPRGVQTRQLAPAPPDESGAVDPTLLYRPTPQIEGSVPMRASFVRVTPDQAAQWVEIADSDPEFRQRPLSPNELRRWRILMETERFVEYLPNGPLCFDPDGLLLNGKHRLSALSGFNKPLGFMVVKDVPRWMFPYFDTGRNRTLNDVFKIGGRPTKTQTGSTMRLAMRFEEFIRATRPAYGWREWGKHRDEHHDVDEFLGRREFLQDWYPVGQQVYSGSKVIIAAATVFRGYQSLAWPEGAEEIKAFCDGLAKGSMLPDNHPALVLRDWAKDSFQLKERIEAKREIHLMLLFRHFQLAAQGDRVKRVTYANGMPMSMPYHPKGHDTAVANVRAALAEIDAEAAR